MLSANNPSQLLMGMLNNNQKTLVNNFSNQTSEQQAEEIARMCNAKGITKQDLSNIINAIKK